MLNYFYGRGFRLLRRRTIWPRTIRGAELFLSTRTQTRGSELFLSPRIQTTEAQAYKYMAAGSKQRRRTISMGRDSD